MIAVIEKDCVTLAKNSNMFCVEGYHEPGNVIPENASLWKIPNDSGIVVGVVDEGFHADIFRYDAGFVTGELSKENLEKNVIPRLRQTLGRFGKLDEDGDMNVIFFFAQGNRCFEVNTRYCISELEKTVETNMQESLTAAYCRMHPELPIDERLKNGFQLAEKHFDNVMFPLSVIDTKTGELRFIGK